MVEELAEDRHPAVERRRQALVGRDVRQEDGVAVHLDAILRELGIERRLGERVGGGGLLSLGRRRNGLQDGVGINDVLQARP